MERRSDLHFVMLDFLVSGGDGGGCKKSADLREEVCPVEEIIQGCPKYRRRAGSKSPVHA